MPISPFNLFQSFQSYVNTYIGGWFRPQTDFQVATNDISNDLWEKWTKQAEKSQEIRDNLGPFLRSKNRKAVPQNSYYSIFTPPDDYGRFASARIILEGSKCMSCDWLDNNIKPQGSCNETDIESQEVVTQEFYENMQERQIDMVDNQRWGAVCQHLTKAPSLDDPKLTQFSQDIAGPNKTTVSQISFKVAPRAVSGVVLDYYIRPTPCVFGYTIAPGNVQTGAGDQIIYDPNKSTNLQWPSTVINEFLWRLGERYGLFTRDQFMANTSTGQKNMK